MKPTLRCFLEESPINPSRQIWAALLDEFGCLDADCWTNVSEFDLHQTQALQVYPNPTTSEVNISIELTQHTSGQFRLISTLGELFWTSDQLLLSSGINRRSFNLPQHLKGTFILSWVDETGQMESAPVNIRCA
ncbi:MAG: hypothetical protein MK086_13530 [Flavobacteriales bacterium]|nr:hypothetical protein [Flavobacteriales bacterium]